MKNLWSSIAGMVTNHNYQYPQPWVFLSHSDFGSTMMCFIQCESNKCGKNRSLKNARVLTSFLLFLKICLLSLASENNSARPQSFISTVTAKIPHT